MPDFLGDRALDVTHMGLGDVLPSDDLPELGERDEGGPDLDLGRRGRFLRLKDAGLTARLDLGPAAMSSDSSFSMDSAKRRVMRCGKGARECVTATDREQMPEPPGPGSDFSSCRHRLGHRDEWRE
ncbi:hypothetical protein [Propylenella binzhouense]|uniref:Uncharacterized protein n=1 Tax=Propylenella binzhouense TaxID=2555902 RepID=A0A964T6V8_9HYPH|nr:hypothetical protein [Propylenella binzhouense]MYZ49631.1 hypothetical protein [Propylenella binzhouense]